MALKLMYITNNPEVALICEKNGVDRIWIDLETLGKEERQKGMNTVKSKHTINDIKVIAPQLTTSEMLVRVNPWNENSVEEINKVIDAGAHLIMLPMWKTEEEVKSFINTINGRAKTVLLLETKEAVNCLDNVLKLSGIDEIHIGLNDLHLSYNLTFMFELLSNGVVELLCNKIKQAGIPYGFGGIAKLGTGELPAEKIIMEHYRLGSTRAILSRSFCNTSIITDMDEINRTFEENIKTLREFENELSEISMKEYIDNKEEIKSIVDKITRNKKNFFNIETISAIKQEYGDAFYLLDSKQFTSNFLELKSAFSLLYPRFNIAYSYKTNYIPELCKIVDELGGYAEVVSNMEVELALKVGVNPSNIIWNGPIKEYADLKEYLKIGVTVNVDSIDEMKIIKQISHELDTSTINIGVRCNFDVSDGVVSRFGFDIDNSDFAEVLKEIKETKNIKLISFQCHFAKRQIDYWGNRVKGMLAMLDKIGIIPERIDLGGGLYGKMPETLKKQFNVSIPTYSDYANVVCPIFSEYFKNKSIKPELVIEPGSALVGDCMYFLGTVKTIKNVRKKYFATILGSQKNISMSGVNPPLEIINTGEEQETYSNIDLVGYTCIEGDVLYTNYSGKIARGDTIVFGNCGSYSVVMKPPFILPNFPILDIRDSNIKIIKFQETFDDIFHTFSF